MIAINIDKFTVMKVKKIKVNLHCHRFSTILRNKSTLVILVSLSLIFGTHRNKKALNELGMQPRKTF